MRCVRRQAYAAEKRHTAVVCVRRAKMVMAKSGGMLSVWVREKRCVLKAGRKGVREYAWRARRAKGAIRTR